MAGAHALNICSSITEAQRDSLQKQVETATEKWAEIAWRTVPAEQLREYERSCEEVAAALQGAVPGCSPAAGAAAPRAGGAR